MKIVINIQSMTNIVERTTSSIKLKLGVESRRQRRSGWYRRILAVIDQYKKNIIEKLLPVIIQDFSGSISVKMRGGKMEVEEVEKLKKFKVMIEESNDRNYKEVLKNELSIIKEWPEDELKEILRYIDDSHGEMMQMFEQQVKRTFFETLDKMTLEKTKLESKVYNFTKFDIDDDIKELFKQGVDSVPCLGLNHREVKRRVNEALLEYLDRYRSRGGFDHLDADDVSEWLAMAIGAGGRDEEIQFYKRVQGGYEGLIAEVESTYNGKDLLTEKEIVNKVEKNGCIMVMCDKNLGMSMFTLELMREADKNLMNQLGAVRINKSKEEVLDIVLGEINKFETELGEKQLEYLNRVYSDRNIKNSDVKFPFLRSTHKIQKMTQEQIDSKDISNLKFRPVIDAKRWSTRGFAALIMKMLRKINTELLELAGPVLGKSKVKNGWMFAKKIQSENCRLPEYAAMISADIQEAYTNINVEMINGAIERISKYLKYPEWKIDLMRKIIILTLGNNYVETSVGLFLFKKVLPMGYKLSGEALDTVALSGEMFKMMNLGKKEVSNIGMGIAETLDYPEELVTNDVEHETKMARGIKSYERYVDDSHAVIVGNNVDQIIDGILSIGFMFPVGLIINIDLNLWRSEFLDVLTWRGLKSGIISTMMKQKFNVPFGHVRKASDHPGKYKLQSLLGELLRNRRIGSDHDVVENVDKSIFKNFVSIGYSWQQVKAEMELAQEKIEFKYSSMFVKIDEDDVKRKQYKGSIVYNSSYRYNEVLESFLNNIKPAEVLNITMVPGPKLKNIIFTKGRYLKRQNKDLESEEIKHSKK